MKVALIHYWLVNERGGEKVLSQLAELYPNADIFTHVYDPSAMPERVRQRNIRTTFINRLPLVRKFYQSYLPLMPWALRRLDLSGYDLIISSESGPAKGICKPKAARHICYCHTPMRYLWDMADEYYSNASLMKKIGMKLVWPTLRKWDLWSATQVDQFIANSRFVADRIQRIYDRKATVIYPPVDIERFSAIERDPQGFYLFFGQLTSYKRADLAVEAFSRMGKPLIVAGAGEELEYLKGVAGKSVEFLGRVTDQKLNELYAGAEALIFPGVEDFGIIPLEAQATGCPVIAYGIGGALETVIEEETGLFFNEKTVGALCDAVMRFEELEIDSNACRKNAQRFSAQRFKEQLTNLIDSERT